MYYTKLMQITKVDMLRLNSKTKLLDLHQRFMLKKELEMLVTQVEKLQYLSVVVLHMVLRENSLTKNEN